MLFENDTEMYSSSYRSIIPFLLELSSFYRVLFLLPRNITLLETWGYVQFWFYSLRFFPTEQGKISRRNTRGNRKCYTILLSPPLSLRKICSLPFHVFPNMEKSCTICLHCRQKKTADISFTKKKTAWFSRAILIVFKEISSVWLIFLCWIRFREI